MKSTIKHLFTILALISLCSFRSDKLPREFQQLLERASLTFIETEGMEETKIIANRQMEYEYAIKYPNKNFEVRYSIRPLDEHIRTYKENLKKQTRGRCVSRSKQLLFLTFTSNNPKYFWWKTS